jgi:hypothetical protein
MFHDASALRASVNPFSLDCLILFCQTELCLSFPGLPELVPVEKSFHARGKPSFQLSAIFYSLDILEAPKAAT